MQLINSYAVNNSVWTGMEYIQAIILFNIVLILIVRLGSFAVSRAWFSPLYRSLSAANDELMLSKH